MECTIKYFDQHGNKSAAYYGNLHLGHEQALRIYLDSMKKHAYAKFQKTKMTREEFIEETERIKKPSGNVINEADNVYRLDGLTLDRATEFLSRYKDPFVALEVAKKVVVRNRAKELLHKSPEKYGLTLTKVRDNKYKLEETGALEDAYVWAYGEDYYEEMDPAELGALETQAFKKRTKKMLDLWEGKTKLGTQIHEVIEFFIENYVNQEPDEDGGRDWEDAAAKALNSKNYSSPLTPNLKKEYKKLLPQIRGFIDSIGGGKEMKFMTEVPIADKKMGVAGTIDLLAFDPDDNVYIFDFKTKEKGKEWLFDYNGPLRKDVPLKDNKKTDGELQTTLYREILQNKGFTVRSSQIVYIEGDVIEDEKTGQYYYGGLDLKKLVNLTFQRAALKKLMLKKGVNIDEEREPQLNKLNNANQLMDNVANEKLWERTEKSIHRQVDFKMNSLEVDEKTGAQYFFNEETGRREFFKETDTEEDKKKRLYEYYEDQDRKMTIISQNILDFFNSGKKEWKGGGKYPDVAKRQALALLAGIDPKTHIVERLQDFGSYRETDVPGDVLIAIDQRDQSAKLIQLNKRDPHPLSLEHPEIDKKDFIKPNYTSVFSRKYSDETLARKYKVTTPLPATDENFKLLRMGVWALELMDSGAVSRIDVLRNGSITGYQAYSGDFVTPTNIGMGAMIPHLRVLNDFTGDEKSEYLKELFTNEKIMNPKTYRTDFVNRIRGLIETGMTTMQHYIHKPLLESIHEYNKNEDARMMIKSLLKAQTQLGYSLASNSSRAASEDYVFISQAILQLANIHLEVGTFTKEIGFMNKVTTTSRINSEAIRILDHKTKRVKNIINRKFKDYKVKHRKLFEAVAAEAKANGKDVFEWMHAMYRIDPTKRDAETDRKNVDVLYMLKDEKDPTLSPAQKEYVTFFNDMVEFGFEIALDPNKFEKVKNGKGWKRGQIPLISKMGHSKIREAEGLKAKVKESIAQGWNRNVKNDRDTFRAINTRIEYDYVSQIGSGIQNGRGRLKKLGLDPNGNRYEGFDYNGLETDLSAILDNFFNDSLRESEYEETLGIYNAMNTIAFIEENENFSSTNDVRTYMDEYVKLIIFNEVKKEDSQFMDKLGKGMTFATLAFSPKQVLLESVTNLFASTNSVLQQAMMGKNKRYNLASWSKAGAMAVGNMGQGKASLVEAITDTFGLFKADSEAFGTLEHLETGKVKHDAHNLMRSKWGYHLNNIPFLVVKQQAFVAELDHKGILEALSTDEDGRMTYDVTLDKRFDKIFHGGKLVKESTIKNSNDKEQREQYASYQFLLKSLEEEGDGISKDGLPLRPLALNETLSMIDYGRSMYGSMDSDQKVLLQQVSYGRMFLKFKNWAIAKKDNYWTRTQPSELRGEKVWYDDPSHPAGGYYVWEAMDVQGIIQTVGHLASSIQDIIRGRDKDFKNIKEVWGGLNHMQKENLAKLAADLIMVGILTTVFGMLFDDNDFFKRGEGKMIATTVMNATSDLNMLRLTESMIDGNPIATLSFMMRTVNNVGNAVVSAATGDISKSAEYLSKNTGLTKSVWAVIE